VPHFLDPELGALSSQLPPHGLSFDRGGQFKSGFCDLAATTEQFPSEARPSCNHQYLMDAASSVTVERAACVILFRGPSEKTCVFSVTLACAEF
jgi:hypothetical protein